MSAPGHTLLQTSLDGQASGGQGALPLCTPHQGTPWTQWGSDDGLRAEYPSALPASSTVATPHHVREASPERCPDIPLAKN